MPTMYKQGEIVWVRYPAIQDPTNAAKLKVRPAIVVSNKKCSGNDSDLIVCPITKTKRLNSGSHIVDNKWLSQSLPHDSEIRCDKIVTMPSDFVENRGGEVIDSQELEKIIKKVQSFICID